MHNLWHDNDFKCQLRYVTQMHSTRNKSKFHLYSEKRKFSNRIQSKLLTSKENPFNSKFDHRKKKTKPTIINGLNVLSSIKCEQQFANIYVKQAKQMVKMFQGSIYLLSVQQGKQFSVLFPKENRSFFLVVLSILFSRNLLPDLLSQISILRKHPALKVIRKTTVFFFLCLKLMTFASSVLMTV